ncbi:MAG TPA: response regulator [Bosea sp. (in: a-proteobacteria)]|uniref:adenylate/guanylate cyclase domain-containing protein n=1 Tax=Bosea sp. (in: a-proteobacteria) TaxID=1871050 RepID=UPI002E0ED260|nr:response regulator [Bosea sp. (in: a-proteobacteria)]
MRQPPKILVVDDMADNVDIVRARLERLGYDVIVASNGEEALETTRSALPDLVLLDVMMPKLDGMEVVRQLKADPTLPFIPILLLTARSDPKDIVVGLDSGADDYLTKPIDNATLVARVQAMLRIKALHNQVQEQADRLAKQASELAAWAGKLEERVAEQLAELERVGRLRRFLAPQIAELVLSDGDGGLLDSHRREVVVLFCDLRGFTAFAETAEPEEVMAVLREYHGVLGPLVRLHEGTLDHFAGDGIMVFFNDPVPSPDAPAQAVRLADAIRCEIDALTASWTERGYKLGVGIGISQGFATLGQIGFEGHTDYTAIGTVANVAARLCADAKSGEILLTKKLATAVSGIAEVLSIGSVELKGLARPIEICRLGSLRTE